ncbi:hypothetical protein D3C72_2436990 [compost metagenome]
MLIRYCGNGTPTIPEAQVKTFIGIGMKPPNIRNVTTAHGDSAIFCCSVAMPASMAGSMPSAANTGFSASNA